MFRRTVPRMAGYVCSIIELPGLAREQSFLHHLQTVALAVRYATDEALGPCLE